MPCRFRLGDNDNFERVLDYAESHDLVIANKKLRLPRLLLAFSKVQSILFL